MKYVTCKRATFHLPLRISLNSAIRRSRTKKQQWPLRWKTSYPAWPGSETTNLFFLDENHRHMKSIWTTIGGGFKESSGLKKGRKKRTSAEKWRTWRKLLPKLAGQLGREVDLFPVIFYVKLFAKLMLNISCVILTIRNFEMRQKLTSKEMDRNGLKLLKTTNQSLLNVMPRFQKALANVWTCKTFQTYAESGASSWVVGNWDFTWLYH